MNGLLFLSHRIPYPPNKGDKIRSFNLLKHLARDYRIFLGAFVDDPDDWRHEASLQEYCQDICLVELKSMQRKMLSLGGLLSGNALSLPYFFNQKIHDWVQKILQVENLEHVFVYSSPMAQYVQDKKYQKLHRVIDFVDVDSEKWRQYSQRHAWPMSWLYAREGEKLLRFDRKIAAEFNASVFVTREEADLFCQLAPETAKKVTYINNGVDTEYFSPGINVQNPYSHNEKVLVFTGAMDYWANEDAVSWFAKDVFPLIRAQIPTATFYIVGARPTAAVRRLDTIDGVRVTGAVKDIRPYLAHACAAVAPMRIARGLQNKVLEAMAMGKPVVATRAAIDGINVSKPFFELISDNDKKLSQCAITLLQHGDTSGLGMLGHEMVLQNYSWSNNLSRVEDLLQGIGGKNVPLLSKGRSPDVLRTEGML